MKTRQVLAVVEGPSERNFVRGCFAPYLLERGIAIAARIVGKPGHKGGVRSFQAVCNEIVELLKESRDRDCTTMFDYFRLGEDWPGVTEAKNKSPLDAVLHIEASIAKRVVDAMGTKFNAARFIPYVQLHEFEALLFSDTEALAYALLDPALQPILDNIVRQCGGPEAINDGPETAPSKRIEKLQPAYVKTSDGPEAATLAGIEKIRQACPHFNAWVERLEERGQ